MEISYFTSAPCPLSDMVVAAATDSVRSTVFIVCWKGNPSMATHLMHFHYWSHVPNIISCVIAAVYARVRLKANVWNILYSYIIHMHYNNGAPYLCHSILSIKWWWRQQRIWQRGDRTPEPRFTRGQNKWGGCWQPGWTGDLWNKVAIIICDNACRPWCTV